jgi:hypothetical protein
MNGLLVMYKFKFRNIGVGLLCFTLPFMTETVNVYQTFCIIMILLIRIIALI